MGTARAREGMLGNTICAPIQVMPLPLNDPRWGELRSSYGDTADVVAWLAEAEQEGSLSDERLGDIINEVQHQGGTSTAMYAVAIQLISLARRAAPERALPLLIRAGMIHANSDRPGAVPCPIFLQDEFNASPPDGARMLAQLLPLAVDFETFKYAIAGLAGFMGHHSFGRFLDGLDLYQRKFYHVLLEVPFPPEAG
jgi:hypothetical protein